MSPISSGWCGGRPGAWLSWADMNNLRQRFGRPLRLGLIGGGPDSWIGSMHRNAAEMDGWFRCTAGVFSSDPARSRAAGVQLGFDAARSYGTVAEMLQSE